MYDPEINIRQGYYLPHWRKDGAIYALRFRLADSLPQEKLSAILEERKEILEGARRAGRPLTPSEKERMEFLSSEEIERFLDAGYGECWLKRDAVATIVSDALTHFQGTRYRLFAWCIMPNHVHIVVQPLAGYELSSIVLSWKTFTARKSNIVIGRTGEFWQSEYFDHLIRNDESLSYWVEYTWANPDQAGLKNWRWRWREEILTEHGPEGHATSHATKHSSLKETHVTRHSSLKEI